MKKAWWILAGSMAVMASALGGCGQSGAGSAAEVAGSTGSAAGNGKMCIRDRGRKTAE